MTPTEHQPSDPLRRTLLRGVAAAGLAAAAGGVLAGCGGGDDVTGALGTTDTGAGSGADAVAPAPTSTKLPTKSEVYPRTPEPRPTRTAAAKVEASAEPAATGGGKARETASKRGDAVATAKKGEAEADGGRKPKKTAKTPAGPEPLPPGALARTSDIPEGGGKVFEAEKVIVTQPTKGTFKGFSATCTHTGCIIDKVAEGAIICPCHGSRFGLADGSVQKGPATKPLPAEAITVDPKGNIIRS